MISISNRGYKGTLSRVDKEPILDNPYNRFPEKSYFHLEFTNLKKSAKTSLKFFEGQTFAAGSNGIDSILFERDPSNGIRRFLGLTAKQGKDPFLGNHQEFYFAVDINDTEGEKLLFSTTDNSKSTLSVRSSNTEYENVLEGTLTEGTVIDEEQNEYTVSGSFRYKENADSEIDGSFWYKVPK